MANVILYERLLSLIKPKFSLNSKMIPICLMAFSCHFCLLSYIIDLRICNLYPILVKQPKKKYFISFRFMR